MSTKVTLYYDQNHHFYAECFDDKHVYLEVHTDTVETTIRFDLEQVVGLASQINLDELRRQAGITDEQIRKHVVSTVEARLNATDFFGQIYGLMQFGPGDSPKEEQIENGINYYMSIRNRLQKLLPVLNNTPRKGTSFQFGLEEIR
jgi:hypothetical protein